MNELLKAFWEWLPVSYEEYASQGISQVSGSVEDDFPHFNELLACAEKIVKEDLTSADSIKDLLDIMAIDNEAESVLELIVEESSERQLNCIISVGMTHQLFEARWQLAELIYRRKPRGYEYLLFRLSEDTHPYVKKRASNCISYD